MFSGQTTQDEQVKNDHPPKRENKGVGVITGGFGSSACTLFGNGAKVVYSNGKITLTSPDGKKSTYPGHGYTATKVYRDDSDLYDVVVKPSNK